MKIMIVDDSELTRRYIRRIADLSGAEVEGYVEAGDGREALTKLQDEEVDIILTDINMPVMDGRELIERIMRHRILRRIPIVVVSTDRTRSQVRAMLALGAIGYVEKPFSPERLGQELRRVTRLVTELDELEVLA